jgi:MFS family permease
VEQTPRQRRVIVIYIVTGALYTLGTSLIWGVNTLFLMKAGLDIFQVMLANTSYTVGQLVFQVPTGVIADTLGRKVCMLMGHATLLVSTLLYVAAARFGWGLPVFILASVLIGLGYTFQIGAADAWLVDALDSTGYTAGKERIFGWAGMATGAAMLTGTLAGGVLGQVDLQLPYVVRAAVLGLCFLTVVLFVREVGFKPRKLVWSRFGEETAKLARGAVEYGWRHPIVRPLMFVSLAQGVFFAFGFYSLQPYLLQLLGGNLVVGVAGVVAAGSAASIVGNSLVGRVMTRKDGERRRASRVLAVIAGLQAGAALGVGLVGTLSGPSAHGPMLFGVVAGLWIAVMFSMGIAGPVRQAFINEQLESANRATVLSLDSMFMDAGGSVGQPALGYIAKITSVPLGWIVGSIAMAVAPVLYLRADAADVRTSGGSGERAS